MATHAAVLAIGDVDVARIVEVGDFIHIATLSVTLEARAMRQVEHTQGLSHHLINNVIVATVETCSVQVDQVHLAGSLQPVIHVIAAQGQQFVVLIGDIGVDIQFHIT